MNLLKIILFAVALSGCSTIRDRKSCAHQAWTRCREVVLLPALCGEKPPAWYWLGARTKKFCKGS